jgi:hypothetical protein
LRCGEPVKLATGTSADATTAELQQALATTMQELKAAAMARDARAFEVLLSGGRGTGGFYALGRRLRAIFTGKRGRVDHTERGEPNERGE